ncbi:hypothetical protein [Bifidobacterium phasiani]|nr:hypothetical protein [Bifidobacterium phasiani]
MARHHRTAAYAGADEGMVRPWMLGVLAVSLVVAFVGNALRL